MRRREFVAGVAAAALLPSAVRAQGAKSARRVDILVAEAIENDPYYESPLKAVREGLRDLGWIEGQNLKLEIHRTAPNVVDVRKHVDALLAEKPDIVVTSGSTTAAPLLQSTNTVPVVFMAAVDPVGAGFVESLAHPGGNATGFMLFDYSLSGKWLEMLKQVAPAVTRAGIIRDPTITSGIGQFAVIQSLAGSVGVDVVPISARDGRELESGIAKLARSQNGG
jgi:putative ABC transport system substrate-binding protein